MIKNLIFCLILLFTATEAFTQKKETEIERATRLKAKYPDDKVCCLKSEVKYSFKLKSDSLIALKEWSEEFASVTLKSSVTIFESYDDFSKIKSLKGFYDENGKYKKLIGFNEDLNYYYTNFRQEIFSDDDKLITFGFGFNMPGEKRRFELEKRFDDIKYLTPSYFNRMYPVEKSVVIFEIPDWLEVDLKEMNFEGTGITKDIDKSQKGFTTYTFTAANCVSLKSEKYSPSKSKVWPHVVFVPKKFTNRDGIKNIFESVDDLYGWYKHLTSGLDNKPEIIKPLVDSLTKGKKTDLEKVKAIFYWVQDNIRYIAFENGLAGYIPENAFKVYETRYGDCKGMANLMNTMLKSAGYNSRLTWIGTRDIPYDFSIPSLIVNNHMICTLFLNDSIYYLDGTEKYIGLGEYAYRIQGRPVLIEDGDKYILKSVPKLNRERDKQMCRQKFTLEGETLIGTGSDTLFGESQTKFQYLYTSENSKKKEEFLTSVLTTDNKNIQVKNIKLSDLSDREKPVVIHYDIKLNNCVTPAGDELYVALDQNRDLEGLMPDPKRQNGFDLEENYFHVYGIEFAIPDNYSLKYVPENFEIEKHGYKFTIKYETAGNKVRLHKSLVLNDGVVKRDIFDQWKTDLKKLIEANNDQLILVKK